MKIFIINPPGFSPFSPPLGLLALASYLRKENVDVRINDASINALHHFLEPHRIQIRIEQARQVLHTKTNMLPPAAVGQLHAIDKKMNMFSDVIVQIWRKEGFILQPSDFERTITALNNLVVFSSLSFLPTLFGICTYHGNVGMVANPQQNPFADYYSDVLIPEIETFAPDLVGVSLSFEAQFPFACAIVDKLVQKQIAPVIAGGAYFSIVCKQLFKESSSEIAVDSILARRLQMLVKPYGVYGEGEGTLANLCHDFSSKPVHEIPGVLYYDKGRNVLKYAERNTLVEADRLPVITLDDVPFGRKYLSPLRIAPLLSSRGCYWNKCAFCDHASVLDATWREYDLQNVVSNMELYKKVHGVDVVFFCDESMSPRFLRKLSEAILDQNLQIRFGTMIRFEKNLDKELLSASRAGCTFLSFGMESGSPKIIKKMRKGYNHDSAQLILDECARCNIIVETHIMFGFPTETTDEAHQTISFLEKIAGNIAIIRASPWLLSPGSVIFKNMETYGVDLNSTGYQLMNPRSYTIRKGIGYDDAVNFVNRLQNHPVLGEKVIQYDLFRGYSEDYQIIRIICASPNDRLRSTNTSMNVPRHKSDKAMKNNGREIRSR